MNPTLDLINENILRVYFTCLDSAGIGRIGFIDLEAQEPFRVIYIHPVPILEIGLKGTFDDNGMVPSSIVNLDGVRHLYYFGFQKVEKVRFLLYTGLALSYDGGKTFNRLSPTPVLDRCSEDLYVRSLAHAIPAAKGVQIWYSGVSKWVEVKGKELPFGEIKYTSSEDGRHFNTSPITCLSPYDDEFSLSRAFVYKENMEFRMIFSRRMLTDTYKLGYARSLDGIIWRRNDDELKVEDSTQDWDSDMICYTSLITLNGKKYMFYNGNGFGKTGFGYSEVLTN